jgi:quinol monooxygenase YgiN
MTKNVYWMLELSVNDGKLDELEALMEEMSKATEADEPGALAYEWWLSDDDKTLHLYERYADSAATMVHLGNFVSKFAQRFMGVVTPTGFTVYGDASDEVKGALADFGPTYMKQAAGFAR